MEFIKCKVEGAWEIRLKPIRDARGYFMRTYDPKIFEDHGLQTRWTQENQSANYCSGILRGLHFQAPPHAETKLVRCISGRILDVFVDLRKNSSSYGRFDMVELTEELLNMVYIPRGCAHAYLTLSKESIVAYKVDAFYAPGAEGGIIWNDDDLNIPWPIESEPLLTEKDAGWPCLRDFDSPFD